MERDLVTSEGVDEGSAASAVEDGSARPGAPGVVGPPHPAPRPGRAGEQAGQPDDVPDDLGADPADPARGPGQQLEAGEG